jgi:hypothetical protein
MKKSLLVLIVAAMCADSFGEILVYKVSDNMSGYTVGPSWGASFAQQFKGSINGYVVVDVNATTLNTITSADANDANNNPAFIAIKKRSFVIFDGNNPKAQTEFDLTKSGKQYQQKFEIRTKSGTVTNKVIVAPQFYFIYNSSSPNLSVEFFQIQGVLTGQLSDVDIGLAAKAVVPKSIKGRALYNILTDFGGSQGSDGNVSFILDSFYTKTANSGATPMTVPQTIAYIKEKLIKSGYTATTFAKFFGQ